MPDPPAPEPTVPDPPVPEPTVPDPPVPEPTVPDPPVPDPLIPIPPVPVSVPEAATIWPTQPVNATTNGIDRILKLGATQG